MFQVIIIAAAIGLCSAARLENTYLPPSGAGGAGGGPGLAAPFGPRPGGGGNGTLFSESNSIEQSFLYGNSDLLLHFNRRFFLHLLFPYSFANKRLDRKSLFKKVNTLNPDLHNSFINAARPYGNLRTIPSEKYQSRWHTLWILHRDKGNLSRSIHFFYKRQTVTSGTSM